MEDHCMRLLASLLLWATGALAVSGGSSSGSRKRQDIEAHGPGRPGRLLRQEGKFAGSGAASAGEAAAAASLDERAAGPGMQRLALGANGAFVKAHEEERDAEVPVQDFGSDASSRGSGGIAWRFIARDGRQMAEAGQFDGNAEIEKRLDELEQRCPLLLEKGWSLIDSAADSEGGHHWIFRGPLGGNKSLMHVSSIIKGKQKQHSILRFSPRKACGPSALLESPPDKDNPSHLNFDELEMTQLDNPNVVDSWLWAADKLKSETAANCDPDQNIDNITLISARLEVSAGLNVFLTVSILPVDHNVRPTYHELQCDWHVESTGDATMHPDLILPYRHSDDTQLGWCELLTESTSSALLEMARREGHEAVINLQSRFGWLGAYRDFHPNPDLVELEDLAEHQARAREHLQLSCPIQEKSSLDTDFTPETSMPSCFSIDTVETQGECGACWAFSVATSLAQRMCIAFPAKMGIGSADGRKKLSKLQLMSCNEEKLGCQGGGMNTGFDEAKKGMALEDDYPYDVSVHEWPWSRTGQKCRWGNVAKPFIVTQTVMLTAMGEFNIRKELYCNGPVTVGFMVMMNWMNFFDGANKANIYTSSDAQGHNPAGGHAVTLFAWGLKDGTNYWKLQNSWGPQWGDSGNFRMERGVNLCGIEEMLVLGGTVAETTGTWQYNDWSSCENNAEKKSRGIRCMGNDLTTGQDDGTCPAGPAYGNWPVKSTFPDPRATNQQEVNAIKSCTASADECSRPLACNGNGDAELQLRNSQWTCECTCDQWYEGDDCGQCTSEASGYPVCRKMCKSSERCNDMGAASGNEWKNEFGKEVHNCECDCKSGYMGDSCEQCVKPEDTWPECEAVKHTHGMSGGTFTTTTTHPPCQVYQGPIELEPPPKGSNPRIVLRCDVRDASCSPTRELCITGSYVNFCVWNGTMCVDKDSGDDSLVQSLRLYLTGHDYALPVEAKRNQSSNVIMWQNDTIGLMPSELGLKSLQHRHLAPGDV
mmetsp:Transcript_130310/g.236864  ORF Transcript_130310/g.236864 Transcript_130310/m.236864 type:complete len:991 (+) Transcript_130310:127-3099(+)